MKNKTLRKLFSHFSRHKSFAFVSAYLRMASRVLLRVFVRRPGSILILTKRGHFYFAKKRTFLNCLDIMDIFIDLKLTVLYKKYKGINC